MDAKKFRLMLALKHPNYILESDWSYKGYFARIVFADGQLPHNDEEYRQLSRNAYWRYFAFGDSIEQAEQKVIEQWNSRKNT